MTTADNEPGASIPGALGRLSVDVRPLPGDEDRFEFAAIPAHGEGRDWRAQGEVVRAEQQLTITRLVIEPGPDIAGGVTGTLVREIPLGALLDYVRAAISAAPAPGVAAVIAAAGEVPKRGGRQALSDELLREVAVLYLSETAPGQPSGAVKRMAERYGRPVETIRTWLARARTAGWLGASVKGRPGAQPGPRLAEVSLEEMKQIYPDVIEHVVVRGDEPPEDAPQD